MGLEMRRRNLEKSDLDSFRENRWNNQNNPIPDSDKRSEDLRIIKDLLDSMEDPLFSEQEAGKATIHTKLEEKESAKTFEELPKKELAKMIENLFR